MKFSEIEERLEIGKESEDQFVKCLFDYTDILDGRRNLGTAEFPDSKETWEQIAHGLSGLVTQLNFTIKNETSLFD